jgi:tetratricopeptide (TPR) repeat protein
MRLLTRTGNSAHAVAHFEHLRSQLRAELDIPPAPETVSLVEQIRSGDIAVAPTELDITYPAFLTTPAAPTPPPLFAGREDELARLRTHLDAALARHGSIVLIAGEAGSGKTTLATEFMQRAANESHNVLPAHGRCSAYGALGDPYLPFREILGMLSGDVETSLAAGAIDREQATRLWEATPHTARLVYERGPSLIGTLVSGVPLLQRVESSVAAADWLDALRSHVEFDSLRPPTPERMQPAIFDEYGAVLEGLASAHCLLLVVDDLQWADQGSIALLWHLARRIAGMRILIVGVFRPEDIGPKDDGSPHPLQPALHELQLMWPDNTIELGPDRAFIDAFLDSEPNDLGADFREHLFSYTNGLPLFTVEMVRAMQEAADLRRNRSGIWTTQESLDWDRVPARAGALIAQRIARLPDALQRDLGIAAIQGDEFVGEVVAAVRADPEASQRLSVEASSPNRLIEPSDVTRFHGQMVTRYRFRHVLFQRYLYDGFAEPARVRLHEATGEALEHLYRDHPDPPVVDLARHFDQARLVEPAITYLHRAGQRAYRMSANEEAIPLLERALDHLTLLPESAERNRRELELLVALAAPVMAARGYTAPESARIGGRVRELCTDLEPSPTVGMALVGIAQTFTQRGEYQACAATSREILDIADRLDDDALRVFGHFELGFSLMWTSDLAGGATHFRKANALQDPERDAWLKDVFGVAPGPEVLAWDSLNTWLLGYPDQALTLAEASVEQARRLRHPFTLCHTLALSSAIFGLRREYRDALVAADELDAIAAHEHYPFWSTYALVHRGVALGHLDDPETGIRLLGEGLDRLLLMGVEGLRAWFYGALAELEHRLGQADRREELIDQAVQVAGAAGESLSEAALAVQRGAMWREVDDARAAEALRSALAMTSSIGARGFELRAATELASLLAEQGRTAEARTVLAPRYERFTEGHHTLDLIAARELLESM